MKPFVHPVHIAAQAYAGRVSSQPAASRLDGPPPAPQATRPDAGRHGPGVTVEVSAQAREAARQLGEGKRPAAPDERESAGPRTFRELAALEASEGAQTASGVHRTQAADAPDSGAGRAARREAPFAHLREEAPVPRRALGGLVDIKV